MRSLSRYVLSFVVGIGCLAVTGQSTVLADGGGTITVPPLSSGQPTQVCYSNSDRANETITVDIDNGEGTTVELTITLDEDGNGSEDWTPPTGWVLANFNAQDADNVTRIIAPPN